MMRRNGDEQAGKSGETAACQGTGTGGETEMEARETR